MNTLHWMHHATVLHANHLVSFLHAPFIMLLLQWLPIERKWVEWHDIHGARFVLPRDTLSYITPAHSWCLRVKRWAAWIKSHPPLFFFYWLEKASQQRTWNPSLAFSMAYKRFGYYWAIRPTLCHRSSKGKQKPTFSTNIFTHQQLAPFHRKRILYNLMKVDSAANLMRTLFNIEPYEILRKYQLRRNTAST